MKIDRDVIITVLLVGAAALFIGLFLLYSGDENIDVFVDGDKVSKDTISIGSVASTADTYEFAPGETMKLTMAVTNNLNQEYDFMITVWKETSLGSMDTIVYESIPVTLDVGESHTFSSDIIVPFESGDYFYSTRSDWSPVGYPDFSKYDDGAYFSITVLDVAPVSTPTPEGSVPDVTPTATPSVTGTPGDTWIPSADTDEDTTLDTILDKIDLEDENTKMLIAAGLFGAVMAIGLFVINKRRK